MAPGNATDAHATLRRHSFWVTHDHAGARLRRHRPCMDMQSWLPQSFVCATRLSSTLQVLAANQSPAQKKWFQGTADAVRQYLWLFENSMREGIEDFLILAGACIHPHATSCPPPMFLWKCIVRTAASYRWSAGMMCLGTACSVSASAGIR